MNTANYTRLNNMKAEINFENQCKFFAQYYRQVIMCDGHAVYECNPEEINGDYLLLTPLSQISEEDAVEAIMFSLGLEKEAFTGLPSEAVEYYKTGNDIYSRDADLLRSKGYAISWMGLSVEELIEANWIKLKEA